MDNFIYNIFNKYFKTVAALGYKKYETVYKMILLDFIEELATTELRYHLSDKDYKLMRDILYQIYGSTCEISIPEVVETCCVPTCLPVVETTTTTSYVETTTTTSYVETTTTTSTESPVVTYVTVSSDVATHFSANGMAHNIGDTIGVESGGSVQIVVDDVSNYEFVGAYIGSTLLSLNKIFTYYVTGSGNVTINLVYSNALDTSTTTTTSTEPNTTTTTTTTQAGGETTLYTLSVASNVTCLVSGYYGSADTFENRTTNSSGWSISGRYNTSPVGQISGISIGAGSSGVTYTFKGIYDYTTGELLSSTLPYSFDGDTSLYIRFDQEESGTTTTSSTESPAVASDYTLSVKSNMGCVITGTYGGTSISNKSTSTEGWSLTVSAYQTPVGTITSVDAGDTYEFYGIYDNEGELLQDYLPYIFQGDADLEIRFTAATTTTTQTSSPSVDTTTTTTTSSALLTTLSLSANVSNVQVTGNFGDQSLAGTYDTTATLYTVSGTTASGQISTATCSGYTFTGVYNASTNTLLSSSLPYSWTSGSISIQLKFTEDTSETSTTTSTSSGSTFSASPSEINTTSGDSVYVTVTSLDASGNVLPWSVESYSGVVSPVVDDSYAGLSCYATSGTTTSGYINLVQTSTGRIISIPVTVTAGNTTTTTSTEYTAFLFYKSNVEGSTITGIYGDEDISGTVETTYTIVQGTSTTFGVINGYFPPDDTYIFDGIYSVSLDGTTETLVATELPYQFTGTATLNIRYSQTRTTTTSTSTSSPSVLSNTMYYGTIEMEPTTFRDTALADIMEWDETNAQVITGTETNSFEVPHTYRILYWIVPSTITLGNVYFTSGGILQYMFNASAEYTGGTSNGSCYSKYTRGGANANEGGTYDGISYDVYFTNNVGGITENITIEATNNS